MIKRNIPKSAAPAEKLREHSFTAMHGIDITTAPTIRDNIYDSTNVDVNLDGSLSIRKPLVFKKDNHSTNVSLRHIKSVYAFDETSLIQVYKLGYPSHYSGHIKITGIGEKIYDVNDAEIDTTDIGFYGNSNDINIINTVNSTIISGLKVNLKTFANGKYNSPMYSDVSENIQYRYFKIIKENDILKCIYVEPETPIIESSETISLNYNTISDYIYAVRDNYQAQTIGVSAILPYVYKDKIIADSDISLTTVEKLTESENFVTFSTVSDTSAYSPYFIKAFLDIKNTSLKNCYCTWEKSYDGVSWMNVPEFINKFEVTPIKIKDNSVSYESLTETFDNSRTVLFCKLSENILSKEDLIKNRPDILILNSLDSATYRFKIITVRQESPEIVKSISFKSFTSGELPINNVGDKGNIKSTFKFILDSSKEYDVNQFKVYQVNINTLDNTKVRTHGISIENFKYNAVLNIENLETILTVDVEYENVSLLEGFAMQTIFSTYAVTYFENLVHTEYAKHLVYYTKEYVDSLETTALENIEQDYTVEYEIHTDETSTNTSAPSIYIYINAGESHFKDLIEQKIKDSKTLHKFSLNSVVLKNISKMFIKKVWNDLHSLNLDGYISTKTVYIDDKRFGMPDGSYLIYYWTGNVIIQYDGDYDEYYETVYRGNSNAEGWENAFIFDWNNNSTSTDVLQLSIPKFKDPSYTAPSEYNGDTGSLILAWQGPKNYNQVYYRNPDKFWESPVWEYGIPETYHPEILKRVLEARTTLKIIGKTPTESSGLGALIKLKYLTNSGNTDVVTKYPSIIDEVLDTVISTDTFESVEIPYNTSLLDSASLTLGQSMWTLNKSNSTELLDTKIPNTVPGNKLYYKHRIFTYGKNFKNCIYVTDVDSFTTPLLNVIDLNSSEESYVTTLIPWRDYLIAATDSCVYLIQETEYGFTSKIINTYIGISEKDSRTCKAILNGIVFKSGTKIYSLQPSMYSSDDSILNITDISKTIANYIVEGSYTNFAIATEQAYYILIPTESETLCLKYEFSRRIWTKYVYPIHLEDCLVKSIEDILVFSKDAKEYYFEKEYSPRGDVNEVYGDFLTESDEITPISFMFDSGQKTDDLSRTKQFVESKIMLATLSDKDTFPIAVDVFIDGNEYKQLHFDAATDGAMLKTSNNDILTLSTNVDSNDRNLFNVMRQMIFRYSGKGKTIRHVISGNSYFNFKFYVLYYRYKNTHNKQ